jgi:hypothetical protein
MGFNKNLIYKIKSILNSLSNVTRNNDEFNKHQKKANVGELVDILTFARYFLVDPILRATSTSGKSRYKNLFFLLLRGKIKGKHIALAFLARSYKKLLYRRIRKYSCFNTVSFRLNFFRGKQEIDNLKNNFFAVVFAIVWVLCALKIFFTRKQKVKKNYFMRLYEELFSKGFWKSSIFKGFLFKGQNYVEDLMQYEGNSILSFMRVIYEKILLLYNTYYIAVSANKNKKTKKFLRNIKSKKI